MKQKFYSLCFYSISLLQFYRTVFHFKSFFFGEGVGTVLIGMLLFPLGIWNSLFYLLFLPTEMARKPQIYRFSILFLPVLYLVFLVGEDLPSLCSIDRIPFKCGGLCVSTGIKSMITDYLHGEG